MENPGEAKREFEESLAAVQATVEAADTEKLSERIRSFAEEQAAKRAAEGAARGMPAGMRPLTDVEEKWFRMKHPEMERKEQDRIIANGLPADTEPITRADLPTEVTEPHAFTKREWAKRKKARKAAARQRARARR